MSRWLKEGLTVDNDLSPEPDWNWQEAWSRLPAFARLALYKIVLVFGGNMFECQQLTAGRWPAAVYRAGAVQLVEAGVLEVNRQKWGSIVLQLPSAQWPGWQEILWEYDNDHHFVEALSHPAPCLSRLGHAMLTLLYVVRQKGARLTREGHLDTRSKRRWMARFNQDARYNGQFDQLLAEETLAFARRWELVDEVQARLLMVNEKRFQVWTAGRSMAFEQRLYASWRREQHSLEPLLYHLLVWCERHASGFSADHVRRWLTKHESELGGVQDQMYVRFEREIVQLWRRYGWLQEEQSTDESAIYWRLLPLVSQAVESETEPAGIYVLADFEIVVPPDQPLWIYARLEEFCKLKSQEEVTRYQLDVFQSSATKSSAVRYDKCETILSFLRSISLYPLPDTVEQALTEWSVLEEDVHPGVESDACQQQVRPSSSSDQGNGTMVEELLSPATLTWDTIYPEINRLPRQWLYEQRVYHRSTAGKLLRTAVHLQGFVEFDDPQHGQRWAVPVRWEAEEERLIGTTSSGKTVVLNAAEPYGLTLRLPGINMDALPTSERL